jgi:hypothetical protein
MAGLVEAPRRGRLEGSGEDLMARAREAIDRARLVREESRETSLRAEEAVERVRRDQERRRS